MDVETYIVKHTGGFGRWQIYIIIACALTMLPSTIFVRTFIIYTPDFRCLIDEIEDQEVAVFDAKIAKAAIPSDVYDSHGVDRCWRYEGSRIMYEALENLKYAELEEDYATERSDDKHLDNDYVDYINDDGESDSSKNLNHAKSYSKHASDSDDKAKKSKKSDKKKHENETHNQKKPHKHHKSHHTHHHRKYDTDTIEKVSKIKEVKHLYKYEIVDMDTLYIFNHSKRQKCSKAVYDRSKFRTSLPIELDWGSCSNLDKDWMFGNTLPRLTMVDSAYFIGDITGALLIGFIADKYGKQKVFSLGAFTLGLSFIICSGTSNLFILVFFNFMAGLTTLRQAITYASEVLDKDHVSYAMLGNMAIGIGAALYVLVAYLSQYWRVLYFYCGVFNLFVGLAWSFVDESPRWLLARGRADEAREILRKAMKLNGKEMTKEAEKDLELLEMPMETLAGKVKRKIEDDNMFGHAIIWFYLFSMQFVYMAIKLNIFALTLNSVNVGSDIYLGFLLINIIELPGQIYSVYLVDRFGMKSILLGSEIIVSGCLMLTAYIEDPNVIISLVGAGLASNAIASAIINLYTAQIFPTRIRGRARGICSSGGRIGSLMASYIVGNKDFGPKFPLLICAVCSLVASVFITLLPETKGFKLPESVEDVKEMSRASCCSPFSGSDKTNKEVDEESQFLMDNESSESDSDNI